MKRYSKLGACLLFCCGLASAAAVANVPEDAAVLDEIVAIVNDDVITANEVAFRTELIVGQMRARSQPLPPRDLLQNQILDRLIFHRLQLQMARQNRINVADEAVNRAILNFARQNNMSLTQFRAALEQEGFNFSDYRENIREEMIIGNLRQRLVNSQVKVSNQEVDDLLANEAVQGNANTEYRLGHILIAVPEGADENSLRQLNEKARSLVVQLRKGAGFTETAVNNSDGRQALEGGDLGWRSLAQVPSLFAGLVSGMQAGDISDEIRSPSGFHIIKLMDKRSSENRTVVTQTHTRHILLRSGPGLADEAARTRLQQLRQRISGGESFEILARSNSDDTASAVEGGDLGWVSPGVMVPEFEEVMNATEPGNVSEVFRSPFGWHILKVEDRRSQDITDQARREKARKAIHMRKVEEQTNLWLRRLRDEAYVELR